MNCHGCPTQIEIDNALKACSTCAERWQGCESHCAKLISLRQKCLKCDPATMSHISNSVSLDAFAGEALGKMKVCLDYRPAKSDDRLTFLPDAVEAAALKLIEMFARLELPDVEILHGLLNGMTVSEISRAYGYKNRMTVHSRLKKAIARHPWICALHTRGMKNGVTKLYKSSRSWMSWDGNRTMSRGYGKHTRQLSNIPA